MALVNKQADIMSNSINLSKDVPTTEGNIGKNPSSKITKPAPRFGKAGCAQADGFTGKDKKVWLFISRVEPHVTATLIDAYLKKQDALANRDFLIEEITLQRTDTKCFRIGADFDLKDALYNEELWPKGVRFTRYHFKRNFRAETAQTPPT